MITVDAETPGVAETVQAMAALLIDEGGFLHPDLLVRERAGIITLDGSDPSSDDWFIHIPRAMLIPLRDVTWDETAPGIVPATVPATLTPSQRTMLHLHTRLLTITDKLARFRAGHPRALALTEPGVTEAIQCIRPNFSPSDSIDAYLATRTFTLRSPDEGAASERVLMPILDLADHDDSGSPYTMIDDALSARFAIDGGRTFVRYAAHRDAIDMATIYGFLDVSAPTAVSAPLEFAVDGLGTLVVDRIVNRSDPQTWSTSSDAVIVDYVALGLDRQLSMFQQVFHPVRQLLTAQGVSDAEAVHRTMDACRMVVGANLVALEELALASDAAAERASAPEARHCWTMVSRAASQQAFLVRATGVPV